MEEYDFEIICGNVKNMKIYYYESLDRDFIGEEFPIEASSDEEAIEKAKTIAGKNLLCVYEEVDLGGVRKIFSLELKD